MKTLNLTAARVQFWSVCLAVFLVLVVALAIMAGAFVLSFSVLKDLAVQGMVPVQWAWIFPAVVDGGIIAATAATVVLNKIDGAEDEKKFFERLLVCVILISVVGNGFHAYKAAVEAHRLIAQGVDLGMIPLAPLAAAAIAVVAPALVLALTHGIGKLIKAIGLAWHAHCKVVEALQEADNAEQVTSGELVAAEPDPTVAQTPTPVATSTAVAVDDHASVDAAGEAYADWAHAGLAFQKPEADAVTGAEADTGAQDSMNNRIDIPAGEAMGVAENGDQGAADPVAEKVTEGEDVDQANAPEQTVEALLSFIRASDLSPEVKETACRRVLDPNLSYAAIAKMTGATSASVALRRYRRAENLAMDAGFTVAPLGEATDVVAEGNSRDALVSA